MPNTYSQIHIHAVFSVQNRQCLIANDWKEELNKYISGIVVKNGHKMLDINGMPDHIHVLFGLRPVQSVSNLLQDIKGSSSKWVNEKGFVKSRFSWQEGYGAFSYGKSDVHKLVQYIANQEEHHKHKSFINEYKELLSKFDVDYNEEYIFKPIEY